MKQSIYINLISTIAVGFAISACLLFPQLAGASEETPGIYIERLNDRSQAVVPGLKSLYKSCADSRSLYKQIFEQGGAGWNAAKESLPVGYNVKAVTLPEPDWDREGVGKQIEKEYFFGDKYALYQYRNRYEISEIDRCALITHEDLTIDIDNGAERFLVTLKDRKLVNATPGAGDMPLGSLYHSHKVKRMPSPKVIREKNDEALESIGKEERIAKLFSKLFANTKANAVPGVGLSYDPELSNKIKKASGYEESNVTPVVIPRANDEHQVAEQPCDIISAKKFRTRLWYWDAMHHYPGRLERPIILKTEVANPKGDILQNNEAIRFRVLPDVEAAVFELDPSL